MSLTFELSFCFVFSESRCFVSLCFSGVLVEAGCAFRGAGWVGGWVVRWLTSLSLSSPVFLYSLCRSEVCFLGGGQSGGGGDVDRPLVGWFDIKKRYISEGEGKYRERVWCGTIRYGSVRYGSGRELVTLRIFYVVKRVSGFLNVRDRPLGGRTDG